MNRFDVKTTTLKGLLGGADIMQILKRPAEGSSRASPGDSFVMTSEFNAYHPAASRGLELTFGSYADYLDWPLTVDEAGPQSKLSVQSGPVLNAAFEVHPDSSACKALATARPAWCSSGNALLDRLSARSADAGKEGFHGTVAPQQFSTEPGLHKVSRIPGVSGKISEEMT